MQQRDAPARAPEDAEARISAYFAAFAEEGHGRYAAHVLRHPVSALHAFRDLSDLPVVEVAVSGSEQGGLLREALPATARGPRSLAAALALPSDPAEYSLGSAKQTLRRKARAAERAGVTWHEVTDPDERRRLLDLAIAHERSHPLAQYRKAPPENPALARADLWLLAAAADARPLVLSITPIDGRAALLGLFRGLELTDEASAARYLMTRVLAEHLVERGVTHLFDAVHPAHLTNGLRHFQRMVGFRLVRVAQRSGTAAVASAHVHRPV